MCSERSGRPPVTSVTFLHAVRVSGVGTGAGAAGVFGALGRTAAQINGDWHSRSPTTSEVVARPPGDSSRIFSDAIARRLDFGGFGRAPHLPAVHAVRGD